MVPACGAPKCEGKITVPVSAFSSSTRARVIARNVLVLAEAAVPGRAHDLHRLMEHVAAEQGARALRCQANAELPERMAGDRLE